MIDTDFPAAAGAVAVSRTGHVLNIALNRPAKRNAWNRDMLEELADAYTLLDDDPELRVAVLSAEGPDFTAGVDLEYFAREWSAGNNPFVLPGGRVEPLGLFGRRRRKPVVAAVHGRCWTIGVELLLATDIRLAAAGTSFALLEVQRGIFPAGGATVRFVAEAGWGNAMRWLLTGDEFDAGEALRMGLIQEVTEPGDVRARADDIARRIAEAAPCGVQAVLGSAQAAVEGGPSAAVESLFSEVVRLMTTTSDAAEGLQSFRDRRAGRFTGS